MSADVNADTSYVINQKLRAELESLKRERAMLVDALNDCDNAESFGQVNMIVINALSATEPQATQWLNDKLSAAKQAGRDEVLNEPKLTVEYKVRAYRFTDRNGTHFTEDQNDIWNGKDIESWTMLFEAFPANSVSKRKEQP